MVLGIVEHVYNNYFSSAYTTKTIIALAGLYTVRTLSKGRKTSRERVLHARTVVLSSPFSSSLGVTVLHELAALGATVICLSDRIGEAQDAIITALREEHKNVNIFIEACDLTSPSSIQAFVTNFRKKENTQNRIDAIIYTHEYPHLGNFFSSRERLKEAQSERDARSLGTFLLTTLLLPTLLLAPVERDIRIINVVNPFYAAAARSTSISQFPSIVPPSTPYDSSNRFLLEGARSLRTVIFSRHLQRILDALPNAQAPKTTEGSGAVPVINPKSQKSNVVSVTVCPGISRHDTVSPFFPPSIFGFILYAVLFPIFWLFTKPSSSAVQTVIHALCLPTPFKILSGNTDVTPKNTSEDVTPDNDTSASNAKPPPVKKIQNDEVLKVGALYRECSVTVLPISPDISPATSKGTTGKAKSEENMDLPDDSEWGGEAVGRHVWEAYEGALKPWEDLEKRQKSS